MKTCPGCGKSCNDNDVYCGFCGFPLNNVTGQPQPQAPVQSQPSPTVPPAPSPYVPPVSNNQNYSAYQNNATYQNSTPFQSNPQYNNFQQNAKPLDMRKNDPLAITALILGIVGAVFMCCYFIGIVPAIVGLILGIISVKRTKAENSPYKGHGMALAGLIISAVVCGLCVICIILVIAGLATAMPFLNQYMNEFEDGFNEGFDSTYRNYYSSIIKSFF